MHMSSCRTYLLPDFNQNSIAVLQISIAFFMGTYSAVNGVHMDGLSKLLDTPKNCEIT
jgi:hypothetical protein